MCNVYPVVWGALVESVGPTKAVGGGAKARQFGWRDAVRVRADVATAASARTELERRVVVRLGDVEVAL